MSNPKATTNAIVCLMHAEASEHFPSPAGSGGHADACSLALNHRSANRPAPRRLSASSQCFLRYATLIAVFSERAVVHAVVDLKLFYLVLIVCLPLLFWAWDFTLPRGYLIALAFLWVSGTASLFFAGNRLQGFLLEALGITASSLFYLLFFRAQQKSVLELFETYASAAYWIALAGFPLSALETALSGKYEPLRSILLEPAHFCQCVLPAFFFYAASAHVDATRRRRMVVLLVAILCSGSSTGYLALVLCAFLLFRRYFIALVLMPVLLVPLVWGAYVTSDHLRLRIDDSIHGLGVSDLTGVNLSTYALLSNLYVTHRTFDDYPVLGAGLGSYGDSHARYIVALPGVTSFLGSFAYDANATDANSLFLRITAEFGLTGLLGICFLIFRFRAPKGSTYANVSHAVAIYLFMKLFREGHYFSPEMYFFLWGYVLSSARLQRPCVLHSETSAFPERTNPLGLHLGLEP